MPYIHYILYMIHYLLIQTIRSGNFQLKEQKTMLEQLITILNDLCLSYQTHSTSFVILCFI